MEINRRIKCFESRIESRFEDITKQIKSLIDNAKEHGSTALVPL